MENIKKLIKISNSSDYEDILEFCKNVTSSMNITRDDLSFLIDDDQIDNIINIFNMPYYIKQKDFKEYFIANPNIAFNYIEDWKNEKKYNLIMLLIVFNYLNVSYLHKIIGNQSKKTYINGVVINDNSLALKKFFDNDYKQFRTSFYKKLDIVVKKIVNLGFNIDTVEQMVYLMIAVIQADIACREKYENGEYFDYQIKINDIVETRNKEDLLFDLHHKVIYNQILNDPLHESLKFLLLNTWTETEQRYLWLTKLITFINNNSEDAKDYLINNLGINKFVGIDKDTKCWLIEEVARKMNLNLNSTKQIINYIFSIGTYYKHRTYNKWYNKEKEAIELFNKYKEYDLIDTLKNLSKEIDLKSNTQNDELMYLMTYYYTTLLTKFN